MTNTTGHDVVFWEKKQPMWSRPWWLYDLSKPKWALKASQIIIFFLCFLDNVHFQQAAEISEALVEEQVDFEAMVSNIKSGTTIGLSVIKIIHFFSSFSGTQTRTMASAARPINTSTPTWVTSYWGALHEVHCITKI